MSVDVSSLGSCVPDAEFTGLLPLFLLSESYLREPILAESSFQMDNVNAPIKKQPTQATKAEATGTQLAETETQGQSTKRQQFRDPPMNERRKKATKDKFQIGYVFTSGGTIILWHSAEQTMCSPDSQLQNSQFLRTRSSRTRSFSELAAPELAVSQNSQLQNSQFLRTRSSRTRSFLEFAAPELAVFQNS
ncbi:hypothetical protein Tco_0950496 [Tanacetum coccineum]